MSVCGSILNGSQPVGYASVKNGRPGIGSGFCGFDFVWEGHGSHWRIRNTHTHTHTDTHTHTHTHTHTKSSTAQYTHSSYKLICVDKNSHRLPLTQHHTKPYGAKDM